MNRHYEDEAIGGVHAKPDHQRSQSCSIDRAPAGDPIHAQKKDAGKLPIFRGVYKYFSRALRSVAAVSFFGFQKYGKWGGWRKVPEARERYFDALLRHLACDAEGEKIDPESGLPHLAHAAWNALAILELDQGQ
jgi:hypothetical protein